ncbi:hypothetical protein CAOG_07289 [Capsaspora owczarzaki ATCC 30864]|uniref:Uncharacterized protein n=1 Tax=Capsaspora owczarzaki (strain ATCC 30864) TaxID=595528 RepID=A0A0D2X597_CAPO3|nr:hypothetical protein CAOG_07289 [Capsaspora owczarzaki ATCC 30864]KJE97429.1 hypothetical protein CAOG_007289 [Capsaspora owczarzaki ATCC 30864]|eukprot:XP_004343148.1 hypothetical protein CAOG_07289 [Capsaspora owczarzaki ATCC 30864]
MTSESNPSDAGSSPSLLRTVFKATSEDTPRSILTFGDLATQQPFFDSFGLELSKFSSESYYQPERDALTASKDNLKFLAFDTTSGPMHADAFLDYGGRGGWRYSWRMALMSGQGMLAMADATKPASLANLRLELDSITNMRYRMWDSESINSTTPLCLLIANADQPEAVATRTIIRELGIADSFARRGVAVFALRGSIAYQPAGQNDAALTQALQWLKVGMDAVRRSRMDDRKRGKSKKGSIKVALYDEEELEAEPAPAPLSIFDKVANFFSKSPEKPTVTKKQSGAQTYDLGLVFSGAGQNVSQHLRAEYAATPAPVNEDEKEKPKPAEESLEDLFEKLTKSSEVANEAAIAVEPADEVPKPADTTDSDSGIGEDQALVLAVAVATKELEVTLPKPEVVQQLTSFDVALGTAPIVPAAV